MKKILVVVLAVAMVMSLAAAAFAGSSMITPPSAPTISGGTGSGAGAGAGAGAGKAEGAIIVKFSTGEVQKGIPANAPYSDEVKAAIKLADKVVKGADDVDEALKAFFEENKDALASGVITMGDDAAEDSVKLAVSAKGFDKVVFTAPGDADGLGFVVLAG